MHIHLDPVGGIAGDMFVAAMLDAFPDQVDGVLQAVRSAGLGDDIALNLLDFDDGVLTGKRFEVRQCAAKMDANSRPEHDQPSALVGHRHPHGHGHDEHDHSHHAHDHHHHAHTHWVHLRQKLAASYITEGAKRHAIGIFTELAWAEAKVHGKEIDDVTFHEVGNWDSIADVVGAASIIDALSIASWSVGSLPIGRGRVKTAHGELPVPAPATTLLLEGFEFHDDGRSGERVTPTGAAILRHLAPSKNIGQTPRSLHGSGYGFGTRKLEGMSNILRVMAFGELEASTAATEVVGVIEFEIDDQSGEDLAVAIDQIRLFAGVIDVTQATTVGKKGRMMVAVRVLAQPNQIDEVITECFRQTTTLGVRQRLERRSILARKTVEVGDLRVKVADRPGGRTAKAESDDVASDANGHRARLTARRIAEGDALKEET